MSKKQILTRRQRNRELAQADAEHRCDFCRRELPSGYLLIIGAERTLRYCNSECREDAKGRARLMGEL